LEVSKSVYLSVVVPLYNEALNVCPLHERLCRVLQGLAISYEIIYVDDGSTDATFLRLYQLALDDPHVRLIQLGRNFGQTAALAAGIDYSAGEVLVCMDGDLQNDALDIPRLLTKLEEGYDVVSGWRRRREDSLLIRRLPSRLANSLIARVTGVYLHDYGCTLKAYRREVFAHVRLYGEMHRLIPAYAALAGARVAEIEVAHHSRRFGASKYGLSRTVRVILDLITYKFLGRFGARPAHLFGLPGLCALVLSALCLALAPVGKLLLPRFRVGARPLLSASARCCNAGILYIVLGLLAELLMRTYYESQGKAAYVVKKVVAPGAAVSMLEDDETPTGALSCYGADREDGNEHVYVP
jgi:glycosyltransferase involved in cell wall biosynthesis